MSQDKIVVVMGGPSTEAEVSRRTGGAILEALRSKGYHAEGMELDPAHFAEQIYRSGCRIVFNALHGKYGEDGLIQGTLDMLGIPYTGSGVLAAAVTMDKAATKRVFLAEGIPTPRFRIFRRHEMEERDLGKEILDAFSVPVVIKAATQGSSIGVHIVERPEDLRQALEDAFSYSGEIVAEEFIPGRELTVAVWGDARKQEAMPVIEITTVSGRYDYQSKYTKGASTHIVPAPLGEEKTRDVQDVAIRAFAACGCRGVARVDLMLDGGGKPYAIEVNSVPGMTATSLVPDAARAMGMDFPELCERILAMAGFKKP